MLNVEKVMNQVRFFCAIGVSIVMLTTIICLALFCFDVIQWFWF